MNTIFGRLRGDDDGDATVEFLILVVPMILLVMLTILVFRLASAEGEVQDAAQAGARAASLARTPGEAAAAGQAAALDYLPNNSRRCRSPQVQVDTGAFFDGLVTVTVTCTTENTDLRPLDRTGPTAVVMTWTEAVDLARTARGAEQ